MFSIGLTNGVFYYCKSFTLGFQWFIFSRDCFLLAFNELWPWPVQCALHCNIYDFNDRYAIDSVKLVVRGSRLRPLGRFSGRSCYVYLLAVEFTSAIHLFMIEIAPLRVRFTSEIYAALSGHRYATFMAEFTARYGNVDDRRCNIYAVCFGRR